MAWRRNSTYHSRPSIAIYADENGDGVPDNFTSIGVTPTLTAGASFSFVVAGLVPITATAGQTGKVKVTATSAFDSTAKINNDTVTVSNNAIVNVTKAIDVNKGSSSPTPTTHTYTLTYTNNGIGAATDVLLTDVLAPGLVYAGNPTWSQQSGAVTDQTTLVTSPLPAHYNSPWQAGNGAAHIIFSHSGQNVNIAISDVAPGETGYITFQVTVAANIAPQVIPNIANYNYNNGVTTVPNQPTNKVNLTIDPTAGVTGTNNLPGDPPQGPANISSASQGDTLYFVNKFNNTGTGTDVFDVTVGTNNFPAGTTFKLYKNNGNDGHGLLPSAPLTDTNGNTVPDTGPVAAGDYYNVILQVTLPAGASGDNGGVGYSVKKIATSTVDPTKSATDTDTLATITASTVDLLNNTTGTAGQGFQDGDVLAAPVTTLTGDPGTTQRFTLRVRNSSLVPDNYDLLASSNTTFPTAFGNGLTVVFRNLSGGVITNTGNVLPDNVGHTNDVTYYADVTIPAHAAPVTAQNVYFQAKSPNSGALDQKLDAITINEVRAITLEPNHTGQTYPGNSIVYSHTLTNDSNITEAIKLATADNSNGATTFTSVIYLDSNTNGILDSTDAIYVPGTSADLSLAAGATQDIFVKVFAPANAVPGNVNETQITATTTTAAHAALTDDATDTTTIVSGQLTLHKYQAGDTEPNGTPDGTYATYTDQDIKMNPGQGIRYKIVVTNNSTQPLTKVIVNDTTPQYTTYNAGDGTTNSATGAAVWTDGTNWYGATTLPTAGNSGVVIFNIGSTLDGSGGLKPGQSITIYFGVKINQ